MDTLIAFFRQEGKRLDCPTPWSIDASNDIVCVLAGNIDIFLQKQGQGAHQQGPLHHLMRIEQNEIGFAFSLPPEGHEYTLLAKASVDSKIVRVPWSIFHSSLNHQDLVNETKMVLERWLDKLTHAAIFSNMPSDCRAIEPGEKIHASKGDVLCCASSMVWIKTLQAPIYFLGEQGLIPKSTIFPLSTEAWMVAGVDTLIISTTFAEVIKDDILPILQDFYQQMITLFIINKNNEALRESSLLYQRIDSNQYYMQRTMARLRNLFLQSPNVVGQKDGADQLLTMCALVGKAQGIVMRPTPGNQHDGSVRERLDNLLRHCKIQSREVLLQQDWWKSQHGPLLGFMRDKKLPVALLQSDKGYILQKDNASHPLTMNDTLAQQLDARAVAFYRPLPEKPMHGFALMRFACFGAGRAILWLCIAGILGGGLLPLLSPILISLLFDEIIPGAQKGQLVQVGLALCVVAFAIAALQLVRSHAALRLLGQIDHALQSGLWDRLIKLPVHFFARKAGGDIAMRAMSLHRIRLMFTSLVFDSTTASLLTLFNFIIMFYFSPQLTMIALALLVLVALLTTCLLMAKSQLDQTITDYEGQLHALVSQCLLGMTKIRTTGSEVRLFAKWAKLFVKRRRALFKTGIINHCLDLLYGSLPLLGMISLFAGVVLLAAHEDLTTGEFLAFNAAFAGLLAAMAVLSHVVMTTMPIRALYQRTRPLLEALPEASMQQQDPGELSGAITLEQISFQYSDHTPLVLDNISLHIEAHSFVALVGVTGSGKSTLLRLLLHFETPTKGRLYYDGLDLTTIDSEQVRQQMGVVLQDAALIPGTLLSNILGVSGHSEEDAWQAAELAGISEDIHAMPMGMYTHVSEGDGGLSGGQRQRIFIARALVKKPRILFFDEATSALDHPTQAHIMTNLEALKATRVIIAHRLSTIQAADKIIVLDKGRVKEQGTYNDLLAQEGLFARLVREQRG